MARRLLHAAAALDDWRLEAAVLEVACAHLELYNIDPYFSIIWCFDHVQMP